jgi:protein TonB
MATMAGALYSNPWLNSKLFERVRPGYVISAVLHIVVFAVVAYFLAAGPSVSVSTDDEPHFAELVAVPPQRKHVQPPPLFRPAQTPSLPKLTTEVPALPIPPFDEIRRAPETVVSVAPPAPPDIVNPSPVQRGGIMYPLKARIADKTGYVDLRFTIEPNGSVGDLRVIAEVPPGYGFADAAEKAFATWRFQPRLMNGKPAAASAIYRVTFRLR